MVVCSYFCVALMSAVTKSLNAQVPITTILFALLAIPLLLLAPWFFRRGFPIRDFTLLPIHLFRTGTLLLAFMLSIWVVRFLPLAETVLLNNSAPVFLPIVAIYWFKERVLPKEWLLISIGMVGVLLVIKPGSELFHLSSIVALSGSFCSALSLMGLKKLLSSKESLETIFCLFFTIGTLTLLPFYIHYYEPLNGLQMLKLGSLGLLSLCAQLCLTFAYRLSSPVRLAPLNFTVVLFGILLGYFAFNALPDLYTIAGALLILTSGLFAAITRNKKAARVEQQSLESQDV